MKSKNNKLEKLNKIIPSKQISYNIENKKSKNKYFFFCFVVDQSYRDKIDISFLHKENIIKPDSLIVNLMIFPNKNIIFFLKQKEFFIFMK
jgi:hypothetical protein